MGVLSFLASLIRESFSIFLLQSEVDVSAKDKQKLVIRKVFIAVMIFALVLTTNRAITLSHEFAAYRKMHKEHVEQCESKNQPTASSDSGNGFKVSSNKDYYTWDIPERTSYGLTRPRQTTNSE